MPATPNSDKVSVMVLTNVATSAHIMAVADATSAVRRTPVQRMPRSARAAATPTVPQAPVAQAWLAGY